MNELERLLRERIASRGPLSMAEVMQEALYHPEYGYYSRLRGFGAEGDFITSPEISPAFGQLLAREARHLRRHLGDPRPLRVLELGGGNGALAEAFLSQAADVEYAIDETSASLRDVQRSRLGSAITQRPSGPAHLVIANEVLDAQPAHRLTVRNGALRELRVAHDFTWIETEAPPAALTYFDRLKLAPPEGAIVEVNLSLPQWAVQLKSRMTQQSLALILDYGYTAEDLFSRSQGTLLTYYKHTLASDPLARLGEQDISVHVDFSSLAMAARDAGIDVLGITSQATLLRRLGILDLPLDRRSLHPLLDPEGLGRIGVLFLGRGLGSYLPLGLQAKEAVSTG